MWTLNFIRGLVCPTVGPLAHPSDCLSVYHSIYWLVCPSGGKKSVMDTFCEFFCGGGLDGNPYIVTPRLLFSFCRQRNEVSKCGWLTALVDSHSKKLGISSSHLSYLGKNNILIYRPVYLFALSHRSPPLVIYITTYWGAALSFGLSLFS